MNYPSTKILKHRLAFDQVTRIDKLCLCIHALIEVLIEVIIAIFVIILMYILARR